MTLKRIVIATVVALVVVLAPIAALWSSAEPDTLQFEIVKSLMQLGVVVVLGGGASAALKVLEQERELANLKRSEERARADEAAARRTDYLARVGSAYRSAKTIRRYLRAAGLSHRYHKPAKHFREDQAELYEKEMRRLNRAQLELEALQIEASSLPDQQHVSQLTSELERMERYLRGILREYERYRPALAAGKSKPLSKFKRLLEFTESADASGKPEDWQLLRDFSAPYGRVVHLISRDLR